MLKNGFRCIAFVFALVGFSQLQATPLIDFSSSSDSFVWFGNTSGCTGGCTLGYTIDVTSNVTVDGLGVFDASSDGLNNSHLVGVWNSSGVLLSSTTVGAGTVGTDGTAGGIGGFAWAGITDLLLSAGRYTVGALFSTGDTDQVIFNAGGIFSNDAGASYNALAFVNSGLFQRPTSTGPTGDRYFGPSLRIASGVPEPSTLILLGVGLLGLGLKRRKLRS